MKKLFALVLSIALVLTIPKTRWRRSRSSAPCGTHGPTGFIRTQSAPKRWSTFTTNGSTAFVRRSIRQGLFSFMV